MNYADADQATALQWYIYSLLLVPGLLRLSQYQSHRIVVTHHRNLSVKFQDISPQLLTGSPSSPLKTSFPAPLDFLTISIPALLCDTPLTEHERPVYHEDAEIQSVLSTSEMSECSIFLRSGHILVYAFFAEARRASPPAGPHDEILLLTTVGASEGTFQLTILVDNRWGNVAACEMSNIGKVQILLKWHILMKIGFLAIAYTNRFVIVVTIRQPT